jgi:shikimate dehydrogenase
LLKQAKQSGCKTISGLEMFLNQAVAQFELWTNRPAPVDVMRAVLESHFQ